MTAGEIVVRIGGIDSNPARFPQEGVIYTVREVYAGGLISLKEIPDRGGWHAARFVTPAALIARVRGLEADVKTIGGYRDLLLARLESYERSSGVLCAVPEIEGDEDRGYRLHAEDGARVFGEVDRDLRAMRAKAAAFDAIESELGPDRIQPTSRTLGIIRVRVVDTRTALDAARKAGE